jgi:hypothetical protein
MASLYGTGTGVNLSGLQTNSYDDITATTGTITTLNSTTGNITTLNTTTGNFANIYFSGAIFGGAVGGPYNIYISESGTVSFIFAFSTQGFRAGTGYGYKISSGISEATVLTYTTLGSTVVNSSLTSLGTLTSLGVNAGTTGRVYINVAPASTYSSWTVNMDDVFADFDLITEEIRIMTSTGEIVGLNIGTMYGSGTFKVGGTTVLNLTTLGSTVVNSSLTSVGTLTGGLNIASGQTYKINSVDVLSSTTLGSTVVNSSLTSVGTLTGGLNIATGQTYKINSVDVLSATTLGSGIINSSLRNITPSTNQLYIGDVSTNTYIEIGTSTSLIDFISSGVGSTDRNARIRCTGGTATSNSGTLGYEATAHNFVGQVNSTTGRIISSANVSDAFFHNIAVAQAYTKSFTALNSAITNGQNVQISFGKAQSTNNCVEIGHAYDGTTPANNKCTIGFYGNGPLLTVNQLGDAVLTRNLTLGNLTETVNAHGSNTLSSCNTIGTENTTTSTYFNTGFTSNTSLTGYTVSASTNSSTAYQGVGSRTDVQWLSAVGQYQAGGTYNYGTVYYFFDNSTNAKVTGEFIRVDMPISVKVSTASANLTGAGSYYIGSVKILLSPDGVSWWVGNTTTYGSNTTGIQSYSITGTASTFYARSIVFLIPTARPAAAPPYLGVNQFYISSGSVSTSPTESIYIPRSLELGTATGSSLPSQVLKVNGTATFNSRLELNDTTYIAGNLVFDTSQYGDGFLINYKNIFCKVYIEATGSVSPNTSFWFPTRGSNVILDNTGVPEYGFIPISYTISGFDYGGTYRVVYDGIYRVSYTIRTADVVDSTNGFMPKYYNPTTSAYVNIMPSDGVFWGVRDGGNRTIMCYTTLTRLLKGYAVMATTFDATTQSWAEMTIEYVSNYNA